MLRVKKFIKGGILINKFNKFFTKYLKNSLF